MSVDDLIRTVMQEFRHIVNTESVIGNPVVVGDTTIIPVSRISFGFGAGGGNDEKAKGGTGTGGGASVEPMGFIVITDGKAQLIPMKEKELSIGKLLEFAPDVLRKLKDLKDKRDKKQEGEASSE